MGFLRNIFGKKETNSPNPFDEISTHLQNTLLPLGFEQKEKRSGRMEGIYYSNGKFLVWISINVLDKDLFAGASSSADPTTEQAVSTPDFEVACLDGNEDKFKNDFLAKLTEWLEQQGIK